jgi:hypothetical protein
MWKNLHAESVSFHREIAALWRNLRRPACGVLRIIAWGVMRPQARSKYQPLLAVLSPPISFSRFTQWIGCRRSEREGRPGVLGGAKPCLDDSESDAALRRIGE